MDLRAAEIAYPRLFVHLRDAGWTETRNVALPPDEEALGFVLHDYAAAFLRSFNGLRVKVPFTIGGRTVYHGFDGGLGPQFAGMDPPTASCYVDRISGTPFVHPVMCAAGEGVGFVLEDGRTLLIDETWFGMAWGRDPFQVMDWLLYRERTPGFGMRELTKQERPPDYPWW